MAESRNQFPQQASHENNMNIATVGPAGYQFQDLVCIELALRFIKKTNFEMQIEGSEDALISFQEGSSKTTIEVQVKQSKVDLELAGVAKILAHFSSRSEDDFLLKRVATDENTFSLIVVGGRVVDAVRPYLGSKAWVGAEHPQDFIRLDEVHSIKASLLLVKDDSAKHASGRATTVRSFAESLGPLKMKGVLRRVFVEEMTIEEQLHESCQRKLFDLYRIPPDIASHLILELREKVTDAKERGTDFVPLMHSVISLHIKKSKNINYLARGDEPNWDVSLFKNSVLLLSGPPKCGKTYAARHYTAQYEDMQYEVAYGDDINTAERFLSLDVPTSRVYLLEDPFGAMSRVSDARERLKKLRRVIEELGGNRKLIVTQRRDILLETFNIQHISECDIAGIEWFDLDTDNSEFLTSAWHEFCADSFVNENVKCRVIEMLESGEQIEVGSLRHLASVAAKITDETSDSEILKLARPDAKELAAELAQNQYGTSLLSTLSFSTNQTLSVELAEIEFILSEYESSVLPTYHKNLGMGFHFSPGAAPEDEPTPQYEAVPPLHEKYCELLDLLEIRRFIEYSSESYNFAHPFYRAVGRAAVRSTTRRKSENLLKNLRRSIYSLSANTSATTIISFDWILDEHKNDSEMVDGLISLAIDAFNHSLFVRTQQNCYRFLSNYFNYLSKENQQLMPDLAKTLSSVTLSDVRWIDSEAMFYWGESQDGFRHFSRSLGAEIDEKKPISFVETYYNKAEISEYLLGLTKKPHLLSAENLLTLLSYEESIIRAQAAKLWFMTGREDDKSIIKRIFQDDQPNVLIQCLQSIVKNIDAISEKRINYVKSHISEALASPFLCAAVLYRIDLFSNDDEHYQVKKETKHWDLFASIIQKVLENSPDSVGVMSSRLANCITEALKSDVSLESKELILKSWLQWVEKKARLSISLDDWILRALEDVIEFLPSDNPTRLDLITRYANLPGTVYRLVLLQELCRHWAKLTDKEKQVIHKVTATASPDDSWTRAVIIINTTPEILAEIFPDNSTTDVFFTEKLTPDSSIFQALVILLFHLSPSANQVGVSANNSSDYLGFAQSIAKNPNHRFFKEAFEYLRRFHIEKFNEILSQAHDADKEKILDHMWRIEAILGGQWNSDGWQIIFNRLENEIDRTNFIETVTAQVHKFIENIQELSLCFGDALASLIFEKTDDKSTIELLSSDVFQEALDYENEEARNKARKIIQFIIEEGNYFPETYEYFEHIINKTKFPWDDFSEKLNKMRMNAYALAREEQDKVALKTRLSYDEERALNWLST